MLLTLATIALAQEPACDEVTLGDLAATPPPAIVVLGARGGTTPDMARARRVVSRLQATSDVTLALQVVPTRLQGQLDRFADGELDVDELPGALDWTNTVGAPWEPYRRLVSSALSGVDVLAVGPPQGAPASWQRVTVPSGYASTLTLGMPEGWEVPAELEKDFVRSVAWTEQRIAKTAVTNWNGRGYLVVLVDRPHANGLGVPWQVRQLTEAQVDTTLLAWAAEPACEPGESVWRKGLYDLAYERFSDR